MAEEITKQTGFDVELIKGRGGIFDVVVEGKKIYSKQETGRFPEHEEILNQLPQDTS